MSENEQNMLQEEKGKDLSHLYYWYIKRHTRFDGTKYARAYGNVVGHRKWPNGMRVHTSRIENIEVEEENDQVIIQTLNTEYRCRLADCDFSEPDTYEFIPKLSEYAVKYGKGSKQEEVKPGESE